MLVLLLLLLLLWLYMYVLSVRDRTVHMAVARDQIPICILLIVNMLQVVLGIFTSQTVERMQLSPVCL